MVSEEKQTAKTIMTFSNFVYYLVVAAAWVLLILAALAIPFFRVVVLAVIVIWIVAYFMQKTDRV